jgi:acetyl esterase/lipase
MAASYSQRQIMLSFAYVAYVDELLPGIPSPDSQIQTDLETAISSNAATPIPPIAGQWSLVWGPVSYTVPGSYYQDNMMYVVKLNGSGSPAQYAVAVRGTNGKVLLDWLMDDFDILKMMPWPPGASGSSVVGNISESTSIGLTTLLAMEDHTSGLTLFQFLANEMSNLSVSQASVCFTGHSLGATLSSVLALYARDNQSTWDPETKAIVTAINFAGPSAGDSDFAAYFDQQFAYTGTSPLPFWTSPTTPSSYADCVRNSQDVAPLAWNATTLATVPNIYTGHLLNDIFPPLGTKEVIGYVVSATSANGYTQTQASQAALAGTFIEKDDLPQGVNAWIAEAEYQHSDAYPTLLSVPQLLNLFSSATPRLAAAARRARQATA